MSMTLSNATTSAKAAQAELTAPVAAKPAANSGNNSSAPAPAKPAAQDKPAPQAQAKPTPTAPQQTAAQPAQQQPQQAASAGVPATPQVATPLFAQLLNLADQVAAPAADETADADAKTEDDATGSGGATAAGALPAMIASLLNLSAAPATPADPAAASAEGVAVRIDTVSATSTLSSTATRLNLSAASVAVNPAGDAATQAATAAATAAANAAASAAQASEVPAGTPQNVYSLANNATLAAAARPSQAEAPAPAADGAAPNAAPAIADADMVDSAAPVVAQNTLRVVPRAADTAGATTALPAAPAQVRVTGQDEGSRTLTAPAPVAGAAVAQTAPAATPAAATVKLAGAPEQWQQPLREALGDRLQVQLQRNNNHAVIRLEPPNMGSIEISIRQSAGALQVNLSASNSDVVRQLNTIGDSVRQDLSTRQFSDVAVTVSSSRAQAQAQSQGEGGRNGQQRNQEDGRTPGRALSDDDTTSTFAMTDRE